MGAQTGFVLEGQPLTRTRGRKNGPGPEPEENGPGPEKILKRTRGPDPDPKKWTRTRKNSKERTRGPDPGPVDSDPLDAVLWYMLEVSQ